MNKGRWGFEHWPLTNPVMFILIPLKFSRIDTQNSYIWEDIYIYYTHKFPNHHFGISDTYVKFPFGCRILSLLKQSLQFLWFEDDFSILTFEEAGELEGWWPTFQIPQGSLNGIHFGGIKQAANVWWFWGDWPFRMHCFGVGNPSY